MYNRELNLRAPGIHCYHGKYCPKAMTTFKINVIFKYIIYGIPLVEHPAVYMYVDGFY